MFTACTRFKAGDAGPTTEKSSSAEPSIRFCAIACRCLAIQIARQEGVAISGGNGEVDTRKRVPSLLCHAHHSK